MRHPSDSGEHGPVILILIAQSSDSQERLMNPNTHELEVGSDCLLDPLAVGRFDLAEFIIHSQRDESQVWTG